MKILIMGAGAQGSAAASILARDNDADEIVLADYDKDLADRVAAKVGTDKITTLKVNADNIDEIAKAAKGCDAILDFVMPWHVPNVMQAALETGAHYVNTAFDAPFWDEILNGEELYLQKEFQDAGLTALLGSGGTPGLYNVVVRLYADKLDTVETILLRCLQEHDDSIENKVRPWNPGWAPAQALIDFYTEPVIFENGEYKKVKQFNEPEIYDFGDIMKNCWAVHHSHEEAYSIPYVFRSKGLKNCNFKYILDEQAATFISMGFTPGNEIEVNGQKVKPFDVLIALTEHPGDEFFDEEPPADDFDPDSIGWGQSVELYGTKDGKPASYKVWIPPHYYYPQEIWDSCGTLQVSVALPAVTGMKMCIEGTKKGVIFAEELDPERFLEIMREKNPSFELTEF